MRTDNEKATDAELVRRVLAGELSAFDALVARHRESLCGALNHRLTRTMGLFPAARQEHGHDHYASPCPCADGTSISLLFGLTRLATDYAWQSSILFEDRSVKPSMA